MPTYLMAQVTDLNQNLHTLHKSLMVTPGYADQSCVSKVMKSDYTMEYKTLFK